MREEESEREIETGVYSSRQPEKENGEKGVEKVGMALRDRTRERSRVLREYQMEKWLFYEHNGDAGIRRVRHNVTT